MTDERPQEPETADDSPPADPMETSPFPEPDLDEFHGTDDGAPIYVIEED